MKINRVSVNNLGLYCGKHIFDFSPVTKGSPIVLFGGMNGAGKTTLFDGIRLCLYGRDMFKRITEKAYCDYLKEKIHHTDSMLFEPTFASISIDFDYAHAGEICSYRVERIWEVLDDKTTVSETLNLYKDDEIIEEINESAWQDFINGMIPLGVSQLFFFDGEKIQNIIADNTNNEFANSVKALLGIDMLERLQADIKIYQARDLRNLSSAKEQQRLQELDSELDEIEQLISQEKDKISAIENDILKTENNLKIYKNKFAAEGGTFFRQRDKLEHQKKVQEIELEQLREQLRGIASGMLPILITKKLAVQLKAQLQAEERQHIDNIVSSEIEIKKNLFIANVNSSNGTLKTLSSKNKNTLLSLLEECFHNETTKTQTRILFGYSATQTNSLISTIDGLDEISQKLNLLVNEYEDSFRKRQRIESDLRKVPADDLIKVMYDKLAELSQKLGVMLEKKANLEERITELERKKSTINIECVDIYKRISASEKNDQKLNLTSKVDNVLEEYKRRIAQQRVERLQSEFLQIFRKLHRKHDLVARIAIDSSTLHIAMFDKSNKELSVERLSSGEKEIYAIALLYALAKTSEMSLPFIIDTPLGRLDGEHRLSLVNSFFPNASHQMIVFSTDTEIGEEYYNILKPYIACEFNLGYNNDRRNTQVKQGYFKND